MPLPTDVTQREIIEFIETAKRVLELAEKHDKTLYGNGTRGVVFEIELLKAQVSTIFKLALLVGTPLIGLIVSFIIGLLLNRIEVVIR